MKADYISRYVCIIFCIEYTQYILYIKPSFWYVRCVTDIMHTFTNKLGNILVFNVN